MKRTMKVEGNQVTMELSFTEEEKALLLKTGNQGYLEIRGYPADNEETRKAKEELSQVCNMYSEIGFMVMDDDAYHMTYLLTEEGKKLYTEWSK